MRIAGRAPCHLLAAVLAVLLGAACAGPGVRRHAVETLEVERRARPPERLNLLVYVPCGYAEQPDASWPLVVFLHGILVEGENPAYQTRDGLQALLERGFSPPFLVASPQQRAFAARWEPRHLDAVLEHMLRRYRVDPDRVHLTGVSLGASAGWEIAKVRADRLASFVPVAGGGDPAGVDRLAGVPVWAFFGQLDFVAPPFLTARAARAHAASGGTTRITLLRGAFHWIEKRVYANPALWAWWADTRRPDASGRPASSPCTVGGTTRGSADRTRRPRRSGRYASSPGGASR